MSVPTLSLNNVPTCYDNYNIESSLDNYNGTKVIVTYFDSEISNDEKENVKIYVPTNKKS